MIGSSVTPEGFRVGVHKPAYSVANFRRQGSVSFLGQRDGKVPVDNQQNFPGGDIRETGARWIYEIINPFPFRGATYIDSAWASSRAEHPEDIRIALVQTCSLQNVLTECTDADTAKKIFSGLPQSIRYDLAANSTDGSELVSLAETCCQFLYDKRGRPTGLVYSQDGENFRPAIDDFELFETVANNPNLPDEYKEVMVLRPGIQGASEIVGDFREDSSHVFEYLRRNSYIPWGHFAANMANDSIRYRTSDLSRTDIKGLRRLYYQRSYACLAMQLGIDVQVRGRGLNDDELEQLRHDILSEQKKRSTLQRNATLWGWNFGYDFSGSGYRLHASHQMIHQQYAMIPEEVETLHGEETPCFSCGDQVADTIAGYRHQYDRDFFSDYLAAVYGNRRMDDRDLPADLTVYADESVLLFVPKAQVSQWELQLMVTADENGQPVGNIFEANGNVRAAMDRAILMAQHIYAGLGAKMVTSIEYSKRTGVVNGQRLLYAFLPKLPWSMGAFSEAQQRFICGHYPEDFARACRLQLSDEKI